MLRLRNTVAVAATRRVFPARKQLINRIGHRIAVTGSSSLLGHPTRPLLQAWAQRVVRQWMCMKAECRHVNASRALACESCGTSKPVIMGWVCNSCSTKNFKGVKLCKKCAAPPDPSVWACVSCNKNNTVDDLDDNSVCGHCGYDMAPLSKSEEEIMRLSAEREERHRLGQEQFDSVSARDSDDQTESETFGFDKSSPPEWAAGTVPGTTAKIETVPKPKPKIVVETIAPFRAKPIERATSIIGRKPKTFAEKIKVAGPPGHDWMCRGATCGTVNGGDDDACSACFAPFSAAQWECQSCAAVNHESRKECFNCETSIPVTWSCGSCNALSSVYETACRSCTASRVKVEPKTVKDVNFAARAAARGRGQGAREGFRPRRADWSCPSCHSLNFASRTRCFKCDVEKPGGAMSTPSSDETASSWSQPTAAVGDGNWTCTSCSASNFRTRSDCWQCKASAGSAQVGWANEESAPQFEKEGFQGWKDAPTPPTNSWGGKVSEDWSCSKCFSKNFKGKTECFKCGAAKSSIAAPRSAFSKKSVKI
jgi:hypothetical protein